MIAKHIFLLMALVPLGCVTGIVIEDDPNDPNSPSNPNHQTGGTGGRIGSGGSNSSGGSGGSGPSSGGTGASGGGSNTGGTTNPPDPNQPCDFPKYERGKQYNVGDKVIYNGKAYEAVDANASQGDPINSPSLWAEYTLCKVESVACKPVSGCPLEAVGGCDWYSRTFAGRDEFYTYESACKAMAAFPGFAAGGGDTAKRELAAFFANVAHETGFLVYVEEINKTAPPYYGRGPMQLTHDYNYRECGNALGVDLISNPNLLSTDNVLSWKSALWFWMSYNGPSGNCHDAISGGSFGRTIVVINGCDKPEQRIEYYNHFCNDFKVENKGSTSCF